MRRSARAVLRAVSAFVAALHTVLAACSDTPPSPESVQRAEAPERTTAVGAAERDDPQHPGERARRARVPPAGPGTEEPPSAEGESDDLAADEAAEARLRRLHGLLRGGGPTTAEHVALGESVESAELPAREVIATLATALARPEAANDDTDLVVESLSGILSSADAASAIVSAMRDDAQALRLVPAAGVLSGLARSDAGVRRGHVVADMLSSRVPEWRLSGLSYVDVELLESSPQVLGLVRQLARVDADDDVRWEAARQLLEFVAARHQRHEPLQLETSLFVRECALEGSPAVRRAAAVVLEATGPQGAQTALDILRQGDVSRAELDRFAPLFHRLAWQDDLDVAPIAARLPALLRIADERAGKLLIAAVEAGGDFDALTRVIADGDAAAASRAEALYRQLFDGDRGRNADAAAQGAALAAARTALLASRVPEPLRLRFVDVLTNAPPSARSLVRPLLRELAADAPDGDVRAAADAALQPETD